MFRTVLLWHVATAVLGFLQPLNASDQENVKWGGLEVFVRAEGFPQPSEVTVRMDPKTCGEVRKPQSLLLGPRGELQNVVVWIEGGRVLGWPESATEDSKFITMNECEFSPRMMIIAPKGRVNFRNLDPVLHTLRAHGKQNFPTFRSHPPNLLETSLRFEHPEIVPLICDMHPWMKAFIVVAPHQNYAVTDKRGRALIKKIPSGQFRIKLWHELLGTKELGSEVLVDGNTQEINFTWQPQP